MYKLAQDQVTLTMVLMLTSATIRRTEEQGCEKITLVFDEEEVEWKLGNFIVDYLLSDQEEDTKKVISKYFEEHLRGISKKKSSKTV